MRDLYRPRWPLLLTLIGGIGAIIALTYLASNPSGEALPAHGGSYVEGVAGTPLRVNPLFTTNEAEQDLSSLVFAGLVRLGPRGDVQPDLVEDEPTVSPDGREYTFRLRRNVSWQDGERLDANDVVFTIQAIQDPDFQGDPRLAEVFQDVQIEALDDYTVVMTLTQPFAPFLAFATVGILPRHLLGDLDAAGLIDSPFYERPIGSGPFRLIELTSTGAVLRSFDGYHMGRPLLETLELRFYRDDATLLTALRGGEIDGALFQSGLTPEKLTLLDDEDRWVRRSLHGTAYYLVYLNPDTPPFSDAEVRRALQHGLDRETLIAEVLDGQALPVDSPIVSDLWAHVSDPSAYAFDPARAEALLDDAGWVPGEGGRTKEDEDAPLQFTLASSDAPTQSEVAQEIARQWAQLGIRAEVQVMGASQFVEDVFQRQEFDAALVRIDPGPDPDLYPFWHSTQAFGEGRNLVGFSNEDADQLLEDGRQTPSVAQRAEDYLAFQEIFAQELPAVLLYTPAYQYVYRADLQAVSPGLLFTLSSRFYNVHLWFVETEPPTDDDE